MEFTKEQLLLIQEALGEAICYTSNKRLVNSSTEKKAYTRIT